MKKLLPSFAGVLFALFALGVAGATLFYSFSGLGLIFPNDLAGQIFGMTLFDLAVLVWFLVFIAKCESTMQYVLSGIGFLIGLAGTLGLVGIEVGLASGMLEAGTMAKPLTYIFVSVLIGHLVLLYAHHVSAPHIAAEISLGVEKAKITDKAEKDAVALLTQNQNVLAAPLARELVARVMHDLNLQPAQGEVLELPAMDITPVKDQGKQAEGLRPGDFLSALFAKVASGGRKFGWFAPNAAETFKAQTETHLPVADDAEPEDIGDGGKK